MHADAVDRVENVACWILWHFLVGIHEAVEDDTKHRVGDSDLLSLHKVIARVVDHIALKAPTLLQALCKIELVLDHRYIWIGDTTNVDCCGYGCTSSRSKIFKMI